MGDGSRQGDPPPVTIVNPEGAAPFVLVCEHASNYVPARYGRLGLLESELLRHIAWDVGAADLTRGLAERLDATAFLPGVAFIDRLQPAARFADLNSRSSAKSPFPATGAST